MNEDQPELVSCRNRNCRRLNEEVLWTITEFREHDGSCNGVSVDLDTESGDLKKILVASVGGGYLSLEESKILFDSVKYHE